MAKKARAAESKPIDIENPAQLQDLAVRLLAFAHRRARVYTWWSRGSDSLARGRTVEDVVQDAMISLIGAKRTWDPESQPDAFEFLKSTVNSELWNLSRSVDNRRHDRLGEQHAAAARGSEALVAADPEAVAIAAEEESQLRVRRDRGYSVLVDNLGDDKELLRLHDLIVEKGIRAPRKIADELSMAITDVNNLKKRFWRVCRRVLALLSTEGSNHD